MLRRFTVLLGVSIGYAFQQGWQTSSPTRFPLQASSNRENEIKRKIQQLKRQGKIVDKEDSSSYATYGAKIRQKLGSSKSKLLGFETQEDDDIRAIEAELDKDLEEEDEFGQVTSRGRIGSLPTDPTVSSSSSMTSLQEAVAPDVAMDNDTFKRFSFDPSMFPREPKNEQPEMSEEELLERVTLKLAEKQQAEARQRQAEQLATAAASTSSTNEAPTRNPDKTTTGVGGTWQKEDEGDADKDLYKPKSGSWGAFPR